MKRKIFISTAIIVIAIIATINVNLSKSSHLSGVTLDRIEAIASNEGLTPGICSTDVHGNIVTLNGKNVSKTETYLCAAHTYSKDKTCQMGTATYYGGNPDWILSTSMISVVNCPF